MGRSLYRVVIASVLERSFVKRCIIEAVKKTYSPLKVASSSVLPRVRALLTPLRVIELSGVLVLEIFGKLGYLLSHPFGKRVGNRAVIGICHMRGDQHSRCLRGGFKVGAKLVYLALAFNLLVISCGVGIIKSACGGIVEIGYPHDLFFIIYGIELAQSIDDMFYEIEKGYGNYRGFRFC